MKFLAQFNSPTHRLAYGLALLTLLLAALPESIQDSLRFDREAVLQGELWRLFSGHFLHLTWGHLLMNLGGLLLVIAFFTSCLPFRVWAIFIVLDALVISVVILMLDPDVHWYVGLSGILHGLFVLGGLADTKVRPLEGWVFLGLIAAKLAWEQWQGALPGSAEMAGGDVLTEAHLYGALFAVAIWPWAKKWAGSS